jgi:hypothetical protein
MRKLRPLPTQNNMRSASVVHVAWVLFLLVAVSHVDGAADSPRELLSRTAGLIRQRKQLLQDMFRIEEHRLNDVKYFSATEDRAIVGRMMRAIVRPAHRHGGSHRSYVCFSFLSARLGDR